MTTKEQIIKEIDKLPDYQLEKVYRYLKQLVARRKSTKTFSFKEVREATKQFKESLSDTIIEERSVADKTCKMIR